jgi:hypothetical protein
VQRGDSKERLEAMLEKRRKATHWEAAGWSYWIQY